MKPYDTDNPRQGRLRNVLRASVLVALVTALAVAIPLFGSGQTEDEAGTSPMDIRVTETAVLAGGCFWGVEAVFERLHGVADVVSGYSGGSKETARYGLIGTGRTNHAESVQISYDPERISYTTLLEVFFSVAHDPTQLNYQGPDVGPQYRSAVFYTSEEQKRVAEEYIHELERQGAYTNPIVTQVVPLEAFYPAEEYHQDFMKLYPSHPYIVYWDAPKIEHLRKAFPELVK